MRRSQTSIVFRGLVVLFALGCATAAQAQPKFHHLQGGNENKAVFFDALRGCIAGDGGRMTYSHDGGVTWLAGVTPDDVRVEMRGIHWLTQDHVIAVGDGGVVIQSFTGGQTWSDVNEFNRVTDALGKPASLYDIFMIDGDRGIAVGLDGAIRATVNGWQNFITPPNLPSEFTNAISDPHDAYDIHLFEDSGPDLWTKGVLATEYQKVFQLIGDSTTANWTWTEDHLPNIGCRPLYGNFEVYALSFEDPQSSTSPGWASGGVDTNSGAIFHTTGGGAFGTWSQVFCFQWLDPYNIPDPLNTCGIVTQYGLTALGPGKAVSAGYASEAFSLGIGTANFNSCHDLNGCIGPGLPPACSPNAPTWIQSEPTPSMDFPCEGRPLFWSAGKIDANRACLTGQFGRIMIFHPGGDPEFTDKGTRHFVRLYGGGDFLDPATGCIFGQNWKMLRTTDGGASFQDVDVDWACSINNQGNDLDFAPYGTHGVAVGTSGFISYSSSGGAVWTRIFLNVQQQPIPDLNAVAYVPTSPGHSDPKVYIAGAAGTVLASHDFGVTWVYRSVPGGPSLRGVSFATPLVGYVVGEGATVYKTFDAGLTWAPITVHGAAGETLLDVATWGDGSAAIAVGQMGSLFEKTSTGTRFNKVDLAAVAGWNGDAELRDVEVLDGGATVRVAAADGTVLFRDAGTWSLPNSRTNAQLERLVFFSAAEGFAISRNMGVLKYE